MQDIAMKDGNNYDSDTIIPICLCNLRRAWEQNIYRANAWVSECDTCYGLVKADVDKIRAIRDNITQLVNDIQAKDSTANVGAFGPRLKEIQTDMKWLLLYVSQWLLLYVSQWLLLYVSQWLLLYVCQWLLLYVSPICKSYM